MSQLVGHVLSDRYRVEAFLGQGGMAEVYRAWDTKRSVHVALKLLNEDLAEDYVFLRRFAREAQALELLQHPHVVRFFGFEETQGLAFLVMEHIDGVTLRRQFKLLGRPLTLPEALTVLQPVCSALHYAHGLGIYHCDVKPANIFIERGGRVVLGDFGIVRLSESATVTFSTPGTPAYMSPEQCREEDQVGRPDDVEHLGSGRLGLIDMEDTGRMPAEAKGSVSRRQFLRETVALGTMGVLQWLAGCTRTPTSVLPTVTRTTTREPTSTPALWSSPTLRPKPTHTPIPDLPLFDEGRLNRVAVAHDPALQGYPVSPPFDPDGHYPEYPYNPDDLAAGNGVYGLVREALRLMYPEGFDSPEWNPLSRIVRPGDCVLIKPNLVDDTEWINGQTTHPSFLRPIIDYVYKACGPSGRILLAEGPWAAGVFDRLVANLGIRATVEHLAAVHSVPVELKDLNKASRETAPLVDLGEVSELRAVDRVWYDAHGEVMQEGGDPGIGRYRIAPPVLEADVVICVPKAKVHCSGGVTLAMKNMLGIIPAWDGPYEQAQLKDCAHTSDVDQAAGPQGVYLENDTIWRSMADLNRILLYTDGQGILRREPQRRYLAIVDGIVAAEESQYHPRPYPLNTVVVGTHPVTVDAVTARCMGFDPRLLKSVTKAAARNDYSLGPAHPSQIKVVVSGGERLSALYRHTLTPELHVFSWQGHLEANDFDAPEILGWQWDTESGELKVTVRDPAGVAWVRVAYSYEGESRMKALQLSEGAPLEGQWRTPFPLGATVRQATLLAGDELFNEVARRIA